MPGEPDNTNENEEKTVQDPFKGSKFEGKTPQEIAEMYANLESRLGTQGEELGYLRQAVQTQPRPEPREREQAKVSDYRKYADDLIVEPERVLPEFGEEIERRAVEKASQIVARQVTSQNQIENFFRQNPELDQHRDIVSVIGEKLYAQYPGAALPQILERTKQEATKYISSLEERFTKRGKANTERTRNAMTTSGGMTREAVAEEEREDLSPAMSSDQQAIMDEIKRIKEGRAKKIQPPRSRR